MKNISIIHLILLLILSGCTNRDYISQYFAFPPEAKPHEKGWSHICKIISTAKHNGPITRKGPKKIEILIEDNKGKNKLKDKYEEVAASINVEISWEKINNLQLKIY